MSARERILIIRLMGKVQEYPEYAKTLGIEVRATQLSEMIVKKET